MNTLRITIRLFGLVLIVGMSLVPPWKTEYWIEGQRQSFSEGYHPIWSPPSEEAELDDNATDPARRIDITRLGIQLLAAFALMNGLLYIFKSGGTMQPRLRGN